MLRALAVFPPKPISFSEEAALRVADGTPDVVDALVDAGLVESIGQGRSTLHQTIVDYASQQGHQATDQERFVIWAADFVEAHHHEAQALNHELPLILAAFSLAAARGFQAPLVRGMMSLAPRLVEWGLFEIAEPLLVQAQRAAQALLDVPGQLRLVYQLAQVVQKRGDYARAEALAEEGIQLARKQQDHDQLSALLQVYGIVVKKRGKREQAGQALNEALTLARASENAERISALLISLGSLALDYGDAAQAAGAYQEALRIARERGEQAQIAAALQGLAHAALRQGEYQQARAWLEEGLEIARHLGTRERIIGLLVNLGSVVLIQGGLSEAERIFTEGLALAQQIGYHDVIGILQMNLGVIATRSGRYQEAYAIFKEALALAEAQGYRERYPPVLLSLAETALMEGDVRQAEGWVEKGMKVAQEFQQTHFLSRAWLARGDLELQREQWAEAARAFDAVASSDPPPQKSYLGLAYYGLARVAAAQGKWDEAQQYGQTSLTCLESIGYHQAAEVRQWLSSLPLSMTDGGTTRQEEQ